MLYRGLGTGVARAKELARTGTLGYWFVAGKRKDDALLLLPSRKPRIRFIPRHRSVEPDAHVHILIGLFVLGDTYSLLFSSISAECSLLELPDINTEGVAVKCASLLPPFLCFLPPFQPLSQVPSPKFSPPLPHSRNLATRPLLPPASL